MEVGLLLLVYIAYLYLPHAVFKIAAELHIDLGRRVDFPEIEELVSSIIPSALLHLQTYALLFLGTLGRFPGPDPAQFARLISDDGVVAVMEPFSQFRVWIWPVSYYIALMLVAYVNGRLYGAGVAIGIYTEADPRVFPDAARELLPEGILDTLVQFIAIRAYVAWRPLYHEYHVWLAKFERLRPWVWVKTRDGVLYHGRFESYDKSRDGGIDIIELSSVTRMLRPVQPLVEEGVNPLKAMNGNLHLKWNRVTDINTVPSADIEEVYASYELAAQRHRKRTVWPTLRGAKKRDRGSGGGQNEAER